MLEECEKNVKWMLKEFRMNILLLIEWVMKYCKKKRRERGEKDSDYIWEVGDYAISLLLFR